jgi:hypothetical protein
MPSLDDDMAIVGLKAREFERKRVGIPLAYRVFHRFGKSFGIRIVERGKSFRATRYPFLAPGRSYADKGDCVCTSEAEDGSLNIDRIANGHNSVNADSREGSSGLF